MRITVRKWGNSASLRIPVALMKAADIAIDDQVEVREEEGRLIIQAVRPDRYDLDELLAGVTPDNLHEEADFGKPVGKEIL
jgi:antitoxin MazE